MNIKDIVLSILALVLAALLLVFTKELAKDLELRSKEGECIARLIAQEVERKDIEVSNGTCKRREM